MSAERPWAHHCVMSLAGSLVTENQGGIGEWISEHVGCDSSAWDDFAILLSHLAAASIDDDARRALDTPEEIVYAVGDVDGEHVDRLAVCMVVMSLHQDTPGVHGVLDAVRAADDIEALCGSLARIASRALSGRQVMRIVETS